MSRIGKSIIEIPANVTITEKDGLVTVKGPKGELTQQISEGITLKQEDGILTLERPSESKQHKALHGLYRALIHNMVVGTSEGFARKNLIPNSSLVNINFLVFSSFISSQVTPICSNISSAFLAKRPLASAIVMYLILISILVLYRAD